MELGQEVLSDPRAALGHEWLLANGLGGSAAGTVAGANTRRSHALLIAVSPHGRPLALLSQLSERVHVQGAWHPLGAQIHASGMARPAGRATIEAFRLDPWPIWTLRIGELRLEKSLFLIEGHQAIAIGYRHLEGPPARLAASPLITGRALDDLRREGPIPGLATQVVPGRIRIEIEPGLPPLTIWHNGSFTPARVWVRELAYPADRAGEQALEDALIPCHLEGTLTPGAELNVVASAEEDLFRALATEARLGTPPPRTLRDCVMVLARERHREWAAWRAARLKHADWTARQAMVAHGADAAVSPRRLEPLIGRDDPWVPRLADALYAALARRGHRTTLLAALPDGVERGADTLRALPALISLRAFDVTRAILAGYVEYLNEGLAPESFDRTDGTPAYGDPAPSLWLLNAAELYVRRSEDSAFLEEIYPALESIVQAFRAGTRFGVRTTPEGLLTAGEGGQEEIRADLNALWYHGLVAIAQMAKLTGRRENGAFYLAWAREQQARFMERLWDGSRGLLRDALTPAGDRDDTRARHLLAASLAPAVLPAEAMQRLVARIERELVTPLGVREAAGGPARLDWVGAYVAAHLRAHARAPAAQARMRDWLEGLNAACSRSVPGHAPEAFDPDASTAYPRLLGAPASLTAAAEILRAWIEEIDHVRVPALAG
jgi:glycogen debranching enzyme